MLSLKKMTIVGVLIAAFFIPHTPSAHAVGKLRKMMILLSTVNKLSREEERFLYTIPTIEDYRFDYDVEIFYDQLFMKVPYNILTPNEIYQVNVMKQNSVRFAKTLGGKNKKEIRIAIKERKRKRKELIRQYKNKA